MSNKPPIEVPQGAIRLNTDSQKLEFFAQDRWHEMATNVPTLDGGVRGVMAGGHPNNDTIDYITISTQGNATDFGNLTSATQYPAGCSSNTRGLIMGGAHPSRVDIIEYVTISQPGNATDFGDLTATTAHNVGWSSQTRGLSMAGTTPSKVNTVNYVTIASTGNANDFGDINNTVYVGGGTGNSTRGIHYGGAVPGQPAGLNVIDYCTIATTGNFQDFGDLSGGVFDDMGGSSNGITAIMAICGADSSLSTRCDSIRPSTLGNSIEFGDLTTVRAWGNGNSQLCSPTRGCFGGGRVTPSPNDNVNTIDYFTFATQGDAVDFGDQSSARTAYATFSNGHGGL